jgi:hypothetical protein
MVALYSRPSRCKTAAKGLVEGEPPKASQAAFFEGESEFSRTFAHISQSYLKSRFVKRPNYIDVTRYSCSFTASW